MSSLELLIIISLSWLAASDGHLSPNHNDETTTNTTSSTTVNNDNTGVLWLFPLHAQSGTQHVRVYLGQPPVLQTWIVDTGSRFTATACQLKTTAEENNDIGNDQNHNNNIRRTVGSMLRQRHANDPYPGSTTHRLVPCGHCQMAQHCKPFAASANVQRSMLLGYSKSMNNNKTTNEYCQVHQRYTEGSSWTAWEINEIVTMAQVRPLLQDSADNNNNNIREEATTTIAKDEIVWDLAVPLAMGCQTEVKGQFQKQYADGILGLERSNYSWPTLLHQHGLIPRVAFRLCLHHGGGWMSVGHDVENRGDSDSNKNNKKRNSRVTKPFQRDDTDSVMRYTPSPFKEEENPVDATRSSSTTTKPAYHKFYNVHVQAVWLGNILLVDNQTNPDVLTDGFWAGKQTILDSGTTDSFLPQALHEPWSRAWKQITGRDYVRHRSSFYTYEEFQATLPDIRLELDGNVTWTLQPKYYMEGVPLNKTDDSVLVWSIKRQLTNRVYTDEPVGAVLGLNAMMGMEVEYGLGGVSVAPANCHG